MGRQTPDVGCDKFLKEAEWKALMLYSNKFPTVKKKPLTLNNAIVEIAVLGGYVKRKGKEPGAVVIWRGLGRLHDLSTMYSIMNNILYNPEVNYDKIGYG